DFAAWQREWLHGERLTQQLAYWKEQLAHAPAVLQLPTDRPRPAVQTHHGAQTAFVLTKSLHDQLQTLSRQEGSSLFMTLLTAFQTLLYRYSGQEDITVGSPIAGRNRAEIEGLIGMFVNTLVLRTDLSGQPTFRDLLRRVRQVALDGFAHQDVPFEMLVNELAVERNLSYSPLFQVAFALQNVPTAAMDVADLTLEPVKFESKAAKFDLSLTMIEQEDGIHGTFEYNTDLFDEATVTRMMGHLQTVLEEMTHNLDQRIADVAILTAGERQELLGEWTNMAWEQPQDVCVHQLFEAQVEQTPDAIAVAFGEQQLTYRELNGRANQLAHHLQKLGIEADARVTLCVERSLDLVVGVLGILKAGAGYVPLDTSYPEERIALILEDTQALVLVTQSHLVPQLPDHGAHVVCLDEEEQFASEPITNPQAQVEPHHLAYMIYTSGSTGRPKAVMVEHRNLVSTLVASLQHFDFTADDVMPWIASVAFDIALFELMNPLLVGGTAVVLTREQVLDLPRLIEEMKNYTAIHTVPSLMRQIVQAIREGDILPESYDRLRKIFIGGDAVPPDLLTAMYEVFQQAQIHVLYGPTEGTIICAQYPVPRGTELDRFPIGSRLHNANLRLYDAHGQLVPLGVPGELYIGGYGVTRGYYGREDLTAEKYVLLDGERWYRTGDLMRRLQDGTLEFLGRIDNQVKIRGFRIELGEIETVLNQYASVHEAVVIVRETSAGDKRLVAYAVPEEGETPTVSELRLFLKEKLPEYMVPSAIVLLEQMPLNPNGKVDRKALPEPEQVTAEPDHLYVAPRNEIEHALADIWSAVLRREHIGVHDNFFELGGDSILSIQIISRAATRGIRLTPKDLFGHPTIAGLATAAGMISEEHIAAQGQVTGQVALTPIQRWFFDQPFADRHHWNMSMLFEARETLDTAALEDVIAHLLQHHDALRMRYVETEEGWQQENAAWDGEVPLTTIDLSQVATAEQEATFANEAEKQQASLDLSSGPVRFVKFDFGTDVPSRLLLVFHHLVVDGVSWRILLEDLETAYAKRLRGEEIKLPLKTLSFQAWAKQLVDYAASDALQKERGYWLDVAHAAQDATHLPTDLEMGANTEESAGHVTLSLDASHTQSLLQEASKAYNTQINDLLLAALVDAFASWTGRDELLLDLEGHGREEIVEGLDISRTVGWFTAVYPAYLQLSDQVQTGERIKAVKEQLRAIPNRGIGYGLLRYMNETEQNEFIMPSAEVSFNYLGQFDGSGDGSSLFTVSSAERGATRNPRNLRGHLLDVNCVVSDGQLHVTWAYSKQVHATSTVEKLAQTFLEALQTLIAHCLSPEAGGFTPSDFPEARLSQIELDRFVDMLSRDHAIQAAQIEQVYELSPMQQGMLFHSLMAPGSGEYISQLQLELQGALDEVSLQRAWNTVLERHDVLRTAFFWNGVKQPLQVVARHVRMPIETLDVRQLTAEEKAEHLLSFLELDRKRGFLLSEAPLMRLTLVQTADDVFRMIWTMHHILFDGWSMPLVFKDLLTAYNTYTDGRELQLHGTQRPYREFIAWLQQQDVQAAETFWREKLAGFTAPVQLPVERTVREEEQRSKQNGELAVT
ncbi:MAG: amino acid adenylation domain-containing protein, partial [Tumebacillaceae bacterium]